MKLHILSDLHLEIANYSPFRATRADVVVLAGDIHKGADGILWARRSWPDAELVYVPGNHEYYRGDICTTRAQLIKEGERQGVHVLDGESVILGGVRFLGATLWTDFLLFGDDTRSAAMMAAMRGLNDFRYIRRGSGLFSPTDALKLHEDAVGWLRAKLRAEPFAGKTVVVTHHLPSMLSVEHIYENDLLSACFASRLDDLMGEAALWIHGHTHSSLNYLHPKGARVICNPRGYSWSEHSTENLDFDPDLLYEL